jgi:uncharacterized membrane protein
MNEEIITPSFLKSHKLIFYSLILAFLGFLDATYLTILHYRNIIPPCTVTNGCETVLTSKYASLGPIPIALLGSLFYLGVIILCVLIITNYKKIYMDLFYIFVVIGFLVSLVLIATQEFLINAFCQYCLLSEAVSTGLLILGLLKFKKDKEKIKF